MLEGLRALLISRISVVVSIAQGNARCVKELPLDVALRRRPRDVFGRGARPTNLDQAAGRRVGAAGNGIAAREVGRKAEKPQQAPQEKLVDLGEHLKLRGLLVEILEHGRKSREIGGAAVRLRNGLPVLARPSMVGNGDRVYRLEVLPFRVHRDGQPVQRPVEHDLVAVAPVAARELDVVEDHELVDRGDDVEVPLPRDVVRLEDGDGFRCRHPRSRLEHGETKPCPTEVVAVVEHPPRSAMVEYVGVLDAIAVPAALRYGDLTLVVEPRPGDPVLGLRHTRSGTCRRERSTTCATRRCHRRRMGERSRTPRATRNRWPRRPRAPSGCHRAN